MWAEVRALGTAVCSVPTALAKTASAREGCETRPVQLRGRHCESVALTLAFKIGSER